MLTGTQMNLSQVRVVDPILTDHARGYKNTALIHRALFPMVTMPTRAAKRIEFGREAFRRPNVRRAPGTRVAQYTFGYEGKPVALIQRALEAVVPTEYQDEAQAVPGIDLQQRAVNVVLAVIELDKEVAAATVARNATAYAAANKVALTGTDQWSDPNSDPQVVIGDAVEVIRARTGMRPNTLVVGAAVRKELKQHPKVRDHFKFTTAAAVSNTMLAEYLDIANVVSGDAIYDTSDTASVDVWGKDAILAYVPGQNEAQMEIPAYGYMYELGGHPLVESTVWDRSTRSWCNQVIDEFSPELVGADAGFLIQNAVA